MACLGNKGAYHCLVFKHPGGGDSQFCCQIPSEVLPFYLINSFQSCILLQQSQKNPVSANILISYNITVTRN